MRVAQRTAAVMRMNAVAKLTNPEITMDEFEGRQRALGNLVLARDDEAKTITVGQATRAVIIEAGGFIPDVLAIQAGLLPADTVLVPCTATTPACHAGVAYQACDALGCVNGHLADGSVCANCDGGGNMLGGPCATCGGFGQVAGA